MVGQTRFDMTVPGGQILNPHNICTPLTIHPLADEISRHLQDEQQGVTSLIHTRKTFVVKIEVFSCRYLIQHYHLCDILEPNTYKSYSIPFKNLEALPQPDLDTGFFLLI